MCRIAAMLFVCACVVSNNIPETFRFETESNNAVCGADKGNYNGHGKAEYTANVPAKESMKTVETKTARVVRTIFFIYRTNTK